jgi:hypothetical protein
MAGIAALAVLFAILPMRAAIALALLITFLILLERSQLSSAGSGALRELAGCVSGVLGFVGGAVLGAIFADSHAAAPGTPSMAAPFWCGLYGGIVSGMVGRFIAVVLSRRRLFSPRLGDLHRRQMLAEVEITEGLMARARATGDNGDFAHLAEYKAKLERDLGL